MDGNLNTFLFNYYLPMCFIDKNDVDVNHIINTDTYKRCISPILLSLISPNIPKFKERMIMISTKNIS